LNYFTFNKSEFKNVAAQIAEFRILRSGSWNLLGRERCELGFGIDLKFTTGLLRGRAGEEVYVNLSPLLRREFE
jgi:hypothetical protein